MENAKSDHTISVDGTQTVIFMLMLLSYRFLLANCLWRLEVRTGSGGPLWGGLHGTQGTKL